MNTKEHIPQTDSIAELARFWDTHDLTDFEDELEEVAEPVFVRSGEATVQFHLPQPELERLEQLASAKGMSQEALVQEWVREKLESANP
jgi:predicted DNA binding CopG/RHH family protein